MPQVGTPNNPSGVNGWQGFGDEEPYGQQTQDASLAQAAPLAGATVAAGPIAAPKRAGRQAGRGTTPEPVHAAPVPAEAQPAPPDLSYDVKLAQWWKGIAAVPGASDLVKQYAALAEQRVAGG